MLRFVCWVACNNHKNILPNGGLHGHESHRRIRKKSPTKQAKVRMIKSQNPTSRPAHSQLCVCWLPFPLIDQKFDNGWILLYLKLRKIKWDPFKFTSQPKKNLAGQPTPPLHTPPEIAGLMIKAYHYGRLWNHEKNTRKDLPFSKLQV